MYNAPLFEVDCIHHFKLARKMLYVFEHPCVGDRYTVVATETKAGELYYIIYGFQESDRWSVKAFVVVGKEDERMDEVEYEILREQQLIEIAKQSGLFELYK